MYISLLGILMGVGVGVLLYLVLAPESSDSWGMIRIMLYYLVAGAVVAQLLLRSVVQ